MNAVTKTIDAAVADLIDREQITQLVHRLGTCLDDGRFDALGALLHADVTVRTPGGVAEGRDEVVAQASRNHTTDQRIQHTITGVIVEVGVGGDADRASVRANLTATFARGDGAAEPYFVMGGIYEFDAGRSADGWLLTRIETRPVWHTGSR